TRRFSSTESSGNTRRPSGTCTNPSATIASGLWPAIVRPSNSMVAARGVSRPEIVFNVVLLPAPLAPISVTISPRRTSSETPCRPVTRAQAATTPSSLSPPVLPGTAEIGFNDPRIFLDLRRRAVREPASIVEDGDFVAHAHHHVHMVLHQDHGRAIVADAGNQLADMRRFGDVESRSRLIEQQERRPRHHRARDFQQTAMSIGERAGADMGDAGKADEMQHGHRSLLNAALLAAVTRRCQDSVEKTGAHLRMQADRNVLERSHFAEQLEVLKGPTNSSARASLTNAA